MGRLGTGLALALLANIALAADSPPYALELKLTRNPTTLGNAGGYVGYTQTLQNLSASELSLEHYGILTRPDGSLLPVNLPQQHSMTAGQTAKKNQSLMVSYLSPAGSYQYTQYLRQLHSPGYSAQSVGFTKSGVNPPAGSPRFNIDLGSSEPVRFGREGGRYQHPVAVRNLTPLTELITYWAVLVRPDQRVEVVLAPTQATLQGRAVLNIAPLNFELNSDAAAGDYQLRYYVLARSRNAPSDSSQLVISKASGRPIPPVVDGQLQQCLSETAQEHGWTTIEEVTSLNCAQRGIHSTQGLNIFEGLLSLDLTGNPLDPQTLALPSTLQSLILADANLEQLASLEALKALQTLDLSGNRLPQLPALDATAPLQQLELAGNPLQTVYDLYPFHGLTSLDLSNTELRTHQELTQIIRNNPQLTRLKLAGVPLADAQFWDIVINPIQMQELDLSRTGLVLPDFPVMPKLEVLRLAELKLQQLSVNGLPALRVLDLSHSDLREVGDLPLLTTLQEVRLTGTTVYPGSIVELLRLNKALRIVALSDIPWNFDVISILSEPGRAPLEELALVRTGIPHLNILPFPELKSLDLSGNRLTLLPALPHPERLQHLNLADNPLQDYSLILPFTALKTLDLSGNTGIDPYRIQELLRNNPKLEELALARLGLYDWRMLDTLIPECCIYRSPLRVLDLHGNRFSGSLSLPYFERLEVLDLADNMIVEGHIPPLRALRSVNLAGNQLQQLSSFEIHNSLQSLNISRNRIHELPPLDLLNNLRELNLAANPLRDLQALYGVHNLQALDLSDLKQGEYGPGYLQNNLRTILNDQRSLRSLKLAGLSLTDMRIEELLPTPELRELDLSRTELIVEQLPFMPRLEVLRLAKLDMRRAHFGGLPALRALDLSHSRLNDLGNLSYNTALQELRLAGNPRLQSAELHQLLVNNKALRILDLSDIPLSFDPIATLSGSAVEELALARTGVKVEHLPFPHLISLDLSGNDQASLPYLPNPERLRTLKLADNPSLENPGNPFTALKALDLSGNTKFTPDMLHDLLRYNPELEELSLARLGLSDWQIFDQLVVDSWQIRSPLRVLELQGNRFSGTINLPYFERLEVLNLADNSIDEGRISYLHYLRTLNLSGNRLTQAKTIDVVALPRLETLDLSRNQLSELPPLDILDNLRDLNLAANPLRDLQALHGVRDLRALDLSEIQLANHDAGYIQNTLRHVLYNQSRLRNLKLAGLPLSGMRIDELMLTPELHELDLSRSGLIVKNLPYLPQLEILRLAELDLKDTELNLNPHIRALDINHSGLNNINSIIWHHELQELRLAGNSTLQSSQIEQLIYNNENLSIVELSDIQLNSDLISSLHRTPLEELAIARTGVKISQLPFPQLQVLNIAGLGLTQLPPLPNPERLRELDIGDNPIADIEQLHWNRSLQKARFANTKLDRDDLKAVLYLNDAITKIDVSNLISTVLPNNTRKLTHLSFANSNWSHIPDIDPARIKALDISGNPAIPASEIKNLIDNAPKLESLGVARMGWGELGLFNDAPNGEPSNIRYLDVSGNQLKSAHTFSLKNLKTINASNNDLQSPYDVGHSEPGLMHIDLRGNANLYCEKLIDIQHEFPWRTYLAPEHCAATP